MKSLKITTCFAWASAVLASATLIACGGGSDSTTSSDTSSGTSTAGVLCDYSSSVFNSSPAVNATATATWSCSSTLRSLTTNGLPDHAVGTFPNVSNPNTIASRTTSVSGKLTPTLTSAVTCCSGPAATASSLDFEAASGNVFSLLVRVTDGGGLSVTAAVNVSLIDVNEPPVLLAPFSRNITENLVGPQNVGAALGVYDADVGQREYFAITGGNGSSWFAVDPCSGIITLLPGKMLDYEAVQSGFAASLAPLTFVVQVTVTDNGAAPIAAALSATASYVISVVDADDPPVFVASSLAVTLPENSADGAAVSALVTVTDQDVFGGRAAWFNQTFAIAGGNS